MTLYDLLQQANEENDKNFQNALTLEKLENKIKETKKKRLGELRKELAADKIDEPTYFQRSKQIAKEALGVEKQFKLLYAPQSKYNEMRARLKDCGVFISNKMMCSLLKTQTGTTWTYNVVEESSKIARLYFQNDLGEEFRSQAGILENGNNLDFIMKKLNNINWFQEYLNAKRVPDSEIMELTYVTGQKRALFPPLIKKTLDNFFKRIQVDQHHPENLSLEDHRFDVKQKYKPRNFYYRYERDKKAGKFENMDGKNGK